MKKIVSSNEITIDEVANRIIRNEGHKIIVFYYSSNKEYPIFLRKVNTLGYAFVPPLITAGYRYHGRTVEDVLRVVTKSRDVFIVERENWQEIFKIKRGK